MRFWSLFLAAIAAGVLFAYHFGLTSTFWAVTEEFTRWGRAALQFADVDLSNWDCFQILGLEGPPLTRIADKVL